MQENSVIRGQELLTNSAAAIPQKNLILGDTPVLLEADQCLLSGISCCGQVNLVPYIDVIKAQSHIEIEWSYTFCL